MTDRFDLAFGQFSAALARFSKLVVLPRENDYLLDASIQRFEFTVETAWKAMKAYAARHEIEAVSPRQAMEAAFKLGLIEDDGSWTAMMKDRNLTSHTYQEAVAEDLYKRLPEHLERFRALEAKLAPHVTSPS